MIKKGDLKTGDLVFDRETRQYGTVTDVQYSLRPRGGIEKVKIQYDDDNIELEFGYGDFAPLIDKIELATAINPEEVKQYVDEAAANCCQIKPLDLTEEFRTLMKDIKNEKEKENMKAEFAIKGFTIKKSNSVDRIIFNAPATIVYMKDGNRYVTKAYKEDFDKEKGLALALLKSFGISYLDLQRLIKSATVQEKKLPKNVISKKHSQPIIDSKVFMEEKKPVEKKKRAGRVEVTELRNGYTIHRGKRRGVGQKLQQGDMVLVRLCKVYDWEELEVVRYLIGRPLMVDYIGEHSLRVKLPEQKRTYEFSRNEVDKI